MYRLIFSAILIMALAPGLVLSSPLSVQGAVKTCYVDHTAAGLNNGSSWANAYNNLQTAIGNLNCTAIWVAEGAYFPSKTSDRTASFLLRNGLEIDGGYPNGGGTPDPAVYKTILSGDIGAPGDRSDNSYHVVRGSGTGASAVLDGFFIQGGNADNDLLASPADRGGGIFIDNGSPTLHNLVIDDNTALIGGGGVYLVNSSPAFTGVTISNNSESPGGNNESMGGGLWSEGSSSPVLTRCQFIHNYASIAGGGFYSTGSPTLTDVVFSDNTAGYDGGGMYSSGNANLTGVTFTGNNSGSNAGGLYVNTGSTIIRGSQFMGNGSQVGGGISVFGSLTMLESTIEQNSANRGGGGLYLSITSSGTFINLKVTQNQSVSSEFGFGGGIVSFAKTASFTNLLLADNNGTNCSGAANSGSMQVTNATIAGNHAGTSLSTLCLDASNSITRLSNSIVWGNAETLPGPDIAVVSRLSAQMGFPESTPQPGILAAAQINIIASMLQDGCPPTATCTDLVSGDPRFADPAQRNYHLPFNSPAMNAGKNSALPYDTYDLNGNGNVSERLPIDLGGNQRIVRSIVDLGAYELQNQAIWYLPFIQLQP